jgi:hypothetical protein
VRAADTPEAIRPLVRPAQNFSGGAFSSIKDTPLLTMKLLRNYAGLNQQALGKRDWTAREASIKLPRCSNLGELRCVSAQ